MQPKVIKSDAEHTAALARLDELMAVEPAPGTRESDELELLSLLVERYEDERFPLGLPDPVEAIRIRMQEEGLRPRDLAPYLGGANKVSEVLARKRPLTLKMMRALHEGLGIPAEILLREPDGRLPDRGNVEVGRFPWREMARRGWLDGLGVAPEAIEEAEEELFDRFFGKYVATLVRSALYRHPPHVRAGVEMDTYALLAWTVRIARVAEAEPLTVAYCSETLNAEFTRRLVQLSYLNEGPRLAREFLAKAGVHLIVERHLPKTRVDGTALLLPHGKPVVALSLRHDRLDHFWFCLLHELAHVKLHLKPGDDANQEWFVDDLDVAAVGEEEEEADRWALDRLVPPEEWNREIKWLERPDDVIEAAERLRINPAIIAGRVRWETREYRRLSRLVGHGEARRHFPGVAWN
jgi:HTH-type transcriptional regulator / antitoxin HigA